MLERVLWKEKDSLCIVYITTTSDILYKKYKYHINKTHLGIQYNFIFYFIILPIVIPTRFRYLYHNFLPYATIHTIYNIANYAAS